MLTLARVQVVGFKRFKGTVDGKSIDSGKLFHLVNLNGARNGADSYAAGQCTEELALPDGEFCKVLEVDGRVQAGQAVTVELELERVTNGRESRDTVRKATLIPAQPKAVQKAA